MRVFLHGCVQLTVCCLLASCGGQNSDTSEVAPATIADTTPFAIVGQSHGVTPFIQTLAVQVEDYSAVQSISYTVEPKAGTFSRPVSAVYARTYLDRRGFYDSAQRQLRLPIFGLYAGHSNIVTLDTTFADGSTRADKAVMVTPSYKDDQGVYSEVEIKTPRGPHSDLNFDFIFLRSTINTPVIVDTDGHIRWMGANIKNALTSAFVGNAFLVGDAESPQLHRLEMDGAVTSTKLADTSYTKFHHELKPGKVGWLAEVDAQVGGINKIESVLAEIDEAGQVLKEWDMAKILRDAMVAGGDEPANFVRDGADWFHMNSAIYHAADNSLLISSRENFVIKIDYETGAIRWILGDTSKHWYVNYPSLRAYALTLLQGKSPIGQHSLSIASDGNLLLFNNGAESFNHPPGSPAGVTRAFSAASKYAIDETARTASEVWSYEGGQAIYSDICSSVFESGTGQYLLNYAAAYNRSRTKVVGLDFAGNVAFDFEYPASTCSASWNGQPIGFDNLVLQ